MKPTLRRLGGGGGQYPYPKEVWSLSGGWWSRPTNWKSNTAIVGLGVGCVTYLIWQYSAKIEKRHYEPTRWIPSMLWAKEFKEGKMGIREEKPTGAGHH